MSDKKQFVHLHTHSHYSLLDGLNKIPQLVSKAKEFGMSAIGLTDHGNMHGAIEFYNTCKTEGIKPIIGMEAYVAFRSRFDKESGIDNRRYHLTLLAKNATGYKNLMKMASKAALEGYYYKPRIDRDLMREYSEGIMVLSGCPAGEFVQNLQEKEIKKAEKIIDFYMETFGKDNTFIEIMRHDEVDWYAKLREPILDMARHFDLPPVATWDSHYLLEEDKEAHDTLLHINTNNANFKLTGDYSFIDQKTAFKIYEGFDEAAANTMLVANKVNIELDVDSWEFPAFPIPEGTDYNSELKRLTYLGLERRKMELNDEVKERIEYELEIIAMKDYPSYFLCVADMINYATSQGIYSNTRGSAAGSLVSYLIGITNINPLKYGLIFERFLNPERPSLPDVDMDFADTRRDEVIEYTREKYGRNAVAQIGTFGAMLARGSVRDVARALGYPYSLGDQIAKLIPMGSQGFAMTLDRAINMVPELEDLIEKNKDVKRIITLAKKIEGSVRHISVHAAGVVIAPSGDVTDYAPVQLDPKGGKIITQYDMYTGDREGVTNLPKFDFLGLRNLTIMADAIDRVKKIRNIDVDIETINEEDKNTFNLISRGETLGVFQFASEGMQKWLKELKPNNLDDLIAMVALYRPGPMAFIPDYIDRKQNPHKVKYIDERLEPILQRTYGIIIYQEDILIIATTLAGYSWLEADKFRKAVGKKIPELMAKEHAKFTEGCVANGMKMSVAQELWEMIETFAAYGFNKCLTGDTIIVDPETGRRNSIFEIYTNNIRQKVSSLDESSRKIISADISSIQENGIKKVYELRTRSGRTIKATDNHPFLKYQGWTELKDLKIRDKIATNRKAPTGSVKAEYFEAATLGYLIAEGNLCHPHGIYYYSSQKDEVADFVKNVSRFSNIKLTSNTSKSTESIYIGQVNQKKGNTIAKWLDEMGLRNKKAVDKFIPVKVWTWDADSLAIFLGKLWQGDGCISVKNQQVYYATSSKKLASDVQHALLRLEILSVIHTKLFKYQGDKRVGYTVVISKHGQLDRFLQTVGVHLIGRKLTELYRLVQEYRDKNLSDNPVRGTTDIIPVDVIDLVRDQMKSHVLTPSLMTKRTGLTERLFYRDAKKIGYSREVIAKIGDALTSNRLQDMATSDIFWDEVVAITEVGKEMTYDLTVPFYHNFVANDVITHNSHAASYAQLSYRTAYMKANYTPEYLTAIMTAESGDLDKTAEIINEAKRVGYEVLPPDINESFSDFTVVVEPELPEGATEEDIGKEGTYKNWEKVSTGYLTNKIRFGLSTIKNFGDEIGKVIIAERKTNGVFTSLEDFLTRVQHRNLNKKSIEALVMTGALDALGERAQIIDSMENILRFNKEITNKNTAQSSLFGEMEDAPKAKLTLSWVDKATMEQKLAWEKELLGLYVSGHPLDKFRERLAKRPINCDDVIKSVRPGTMVTLGGIISDARVILTKKNQNMAFVKLADLSGSIECVVFSDCYQDYQELFQADQLVVLSGRVSDRGGDKSVVVEKAKPLS